MIDADMSKVMVLGREEELECEICVDETQLGHISEFKYLGDVLNELSTDVAECHRKVGYK